MLISVKNLSRFWNIDPKRILHVGGHEGEEFEDYKRYFSAPVTWVEAQPNKVEIIQKKIKGSDNNVISATVWSVGGVNLNLNVMTNSQSSSLFELGTHSTEHPEIEFSHKLQVTTSTLDDIVGEKEFDYISLDIQGAELEALKGFSTGIRNVKWIYTEVNRMSLYEGCCLVDQLDLFLSKEGFERVATRWTRHQWGDALYISRSIKRKQTSIRYIGWKVLSLTRAGYQFLYLVKKSFRFFKSS